MLYDKFANDKKLAKQRIASLKRYGDILLRFGLYVLDMISDVTLLIFVGSALLTVRSLTTESKDQIATNCGVSDMEKNLDFIDNILLKYVKQLGIVLAASLFAQSRWSYINFDFMHNKDYPCGCLGKLFVSLCSVILCPFLMFYNICQTDLILHDSKREFECQHNICDADEGSEDNICDAEAGNESCLGLKKQDIWPKGGF